MLPYSGADSELFSTSSTPTYLVAPFWAHSRGGNISFEVFNSSHSPDVLQDVSSFINKEEEGEGFSGIWMLVAEWANMLEYGTDSPVVS